MDIPFGYCHCGCGELTKPAAYTDNVRSYIKGEPQRFLRGHHLRTIIGSIPPPNPSGLCKCGCGQFAPIAKRSIGKKMVVKGQYRLYIPGHQARKFPAEFTVEDRGYKTPCWIWRRGSDHAGYGRITNHKRRMILVHVVKYVEKYGPVPEGCVLDHLCKIPACINPDHLEPVPQQVNVQRGGASKLSPQAVIEIRKMRESGAGVADIASKFSVHPHTVGRVLRKDSWANIP